MPEVAVRVDEIQSERQGHDSDVQSYSNVDADGLKRRLHFWCDGVNDARPWRLPFDGETVTQFVGDNRFRFHAHFRVGGGMEGDPVHSGDCQYGSDTGCDS
jgi:hypothetical protein